MTKLTRFGYVINKNDYPIEKIECVKEDLTVKPFKMGNFGKFHKDDSFPIYLENGDFMGLPRYYGIEKFGQPQINKLMTTAYPEFDMQYLGVLRPNQQIIVDKVCAAFDDPAKGGGILVAGCGSGKTNMAIYLACKYKLKTLFVVHKSFLKDQAINRIKSTTNLKHVGLIQQKKVDINHPIVVGMVQSLSKIDYDDSIFKDFGMIIIDEVHHMGAKNFSKLYQKMTAKYMLGISAEQRRNDGLYKIINWYMGPFLHIEEQKPNDMVIVKKYYYSSSNDERMKVITNKYTKEPDRSTMITNLVHIYCRNRFILNLINVLADMGKNILLLTGRIKQVNLMYKLLKKSEYTKGCVGKYIGGMSEDKLAISATKQIILGTYSMAEEGLDISSLNVVILCTPKSAIKQSVGRILRQEFYEEHPIVIDICDYDNEVFCKQSNTRDNYYRKQNYNLQSFNISDYKKENFNSYDNLEYLKQTILEKPDKKKKFVAKTEEINASDIEMLSD